MAPDRETESGDERGVQIPAEPDLDPRGTVDALERRINEEKSGSPEPGKADSAE